MPKYIHTKIHRLDNGDVEVESQLNLSVMKTLRASDYVDPVAALKAAKRFTREAIFNKLYQKPQQDAWDAYEAARRLLMDSIPGAWQYMEAERVLKESFVPLIAAGKWLEEDAKDSGD